MYIYSLSLPLSLPPPFPPLSLSLFLSLSLSLSLPPFLPPSLPFSLSPSLPLPPPPLSLSLQLTSPNDKLGSVLARLDLPTEEMEKGQQPFRLKLSQRLTDPGGTTTITHTHTHLIVRAKICALRRNSYEDNFLQLEKHHHMLKEHFVYH